MFLFTAVSFAQQRFSSDSYNFSITFPRDWDVSTKNSIYIVEAYEDRYTGISISATRYNMLPDSFDIGYIQKDSLKKIIETQFKYVYSRAIVLNSGTGQMDGVLAYYYFVQYPDNKDGVPTKFVSFQYQFVYRKIFYSMFAICPANIYEEYEKKFNDVYKTFRFIKKR